MALKDIVVVLDPNTRTAGPYAAALASEFEAHLTATTFVLDPTTTVAWPEASLPYMASVLEDARAEGHRTLEGFAAEARRLGVIVEVRPVEVAFGLTGRALGPVARLFDLTILEQPNPDAPSEREIMLESALFGSGRPVLIVPYVQIAPFRLETVLVAWDGSATSARAVGDAMPFLVRATRVEVVTLGETADAQEAPGQALTRHLARHGVAAVFRSHPTADDVASTLLSHAFDAEADLMVMGGYGHSRFREFILGGATRGILETMTLPVLMSH
ncbi:MAG TPA: universal stress protein [Microvirga sp.]|jgi:nucleotide-binding universal stress UspA family protein|nr:universal stress protein [Microvirga sp.]